MDEHNIDCPFCGETITTLIDSSAGNQQYTEDCQVCCSPILLSIEIDHDGTILSVRASKACSYAIDELCWSAD